MIWRESQDHSSFGYFCITKIKEICTKSNYTVKYSNSAYGMGPVSHSEHLPVPLSPTDLRTEDEIEDEEETNATVN